MAASMALLVACSNEPTNPTLAAPSTSAADLGALTAPLSSTLTLLSGVQRSTPLAASITETKTIGSAGGTLSIAAAGVTVTIPSGALSAQTVITMTARAGSLVAYDFAPHGITYEKPLVITQKLQGTNATVLNSSLLTLGYYADPSQLTATSGLVSELIGGSVNLLSWTFTSSIPHFSGYMMGCGRASEE